MKTSESIKELAAALCNVQAALEPARFNSMNPYFKSKYADLNSVFEACRHLMSDNGLSLVQFPSTAPVEYGAAVSLTSRLMHESGEWMEDTMIIPLVKATAQDYGSALTYARRYAVSAIIGIVADEDDDGNQAQGGGVSGRNVTKKPPKAKQNGATAPKSNSITDIRSSLEETERLTLGLVADRAAMTKLYENKHQALNAIKSFEFPKDAEVTIEFKQVVTKAGALKIFDWLVERKKADAANGVEA